MKKYIVTLLLALSVFGVSVQAENGISLNIDGKEINFDVMPQVIDGRTMVPVRAIFEAVGADVIWNDQTKTVTGIKDSINVVMSVDSRVEIINGEECEMDAAPVIINGRTLAPARYVAEAFGCDVNWNGDTKCVSISTPVNVLLVESNTETTTAGATEYATQKSENNENWVSLLLNKDVKPGPINTQKIKSEELLELHKNVRYNFEQKHLPEILFSDSKALGEMLINNPEKFSDTVAEEWELNAASYIIEYATECDEEYLISTADDLYKMIEEIEGKSCLYSTDNMGLSICKIDDDNCLVLFEMADDNYITHCSYIAVVYNKDTGFKYYTLEQSLNDSYAVCVIDKTGRGTIDMINNAGKDNKRIFIEIINDIISGKNSGKPLTRLEINN